MERRCSLMHLGAGADGAAMAKLGGQLPRLVSGGTSADDYLHRRAAGARRFHLTETT